MKKFNNYNLNLVNLLDTEEADTTKISASLAFHIGSTYVKEAVEEFKIAGIDPEKSYVLFPMIYFDKFVVEKMDIKTALLVWHQNRGIKSNTTRKSTINFINRGITYICELLDNPEAGRIEYIAVETFDYTLEPDEEDDELNDEDETLQYKKFDFKTYSIDSVEIEEILDSLDINAVQLIDETQNAAQLLTEKVERLDNLQFENKNKEALYKLSGGVPADYIKDILKANIYSTEDYIFRAVDHRILEALVKQNWELVELIPCDYTDYTDIENGASRVPIEQVKDAREHIIESINFYNFLSNCVKELYPEAEKIA